MAKKDRILPEVGMVAAITLSQGFLGMGVIVKRKDLGDGIYDTIWALYDIKATSKTDLLEKMNSDDYMANPIIVCGMEYEEIQNRKWEILGTKNIQFNNVELGDDIKVNRLFNESVSGASFIEMYTGLKPWDMYHDPVALDKRLLPPYSRPEKPLLK